MHQIHSVPIRIFLVSHKVRLTITCFHSCFSSIIKIYSPFLFLWWIRPSDRSQSRIYLKLYILQTGGRSPWTVAQPIVRTIQTRKKSRHASMPQMGFEISNEMFQWTKELRVLYLTAIAIDKNLFL
jgi:hypothetical protein